MPKTDAIQEYLKLYPDDRLAALLAHAEDGKLAYCSCCCLAGALTADHPLKGEELEYCAPHYLKATENPLANTAGNEYFLLAGKQTSEKDEPDAQRRQILIPLIRAEMDRRERERSVMPEPEAVNAIR